jgi:hypothetical protein
MHCLIARIFEVFFVSQFSTSNNKRKFLILGLTGANENTENPWSSNSRAESMDTEEIRVMAEFPPLNQ